MTTAQVFQKGIIKTYRKDIWTPFIKGIKAYNLIQDGDKIMVAISGGKDSLILAKLLQELTNHPLVKFEVVFVAMDPGYTPFNRHRLEENAKLLDIDLKVENRDIFKIAALKSPKYPCFLCARMRRGALYGLAEQYGCNKVALGHHYDDVIETTLLNLFYEGSIKTMLPKLKSDNYEGIQLIRPLYLLREHNIKKVMKRYNINTLDCACTVTANETASKRKEIKALIQQLKTQFGDIDKTIFSATNNVYLDHLIGWEKDGVKYRFDE